MFINLQFLKIFSIFATITIFLISPISAEPLSKFPGKWLGYGYNCYTKDNNLTAIPYEQIMITSSGTKIIAKKITGDDCVTADSVTFIITARENISIGDTYFAMIQSGSPQNPNSEWTVAHAKLVSLHEISLFTSEWAITLLRD